MIRRLILIRAFWDDEAKVWVAASDDMEGLMAEAATIEKLRDKLLVMISELLELDNVESDLPEIPVHIMAEMSARVRNPRAA